MLDGSTDPSALCALIERPAGVNAGAIHIFTGSQPSRRTRDAKVRRNFSTLGATTKAQ